jgi:hypothetical protein
MNKKEDQTTFDVFISYRRNGGAEKAQLVKSELQQRGLSDERIFLDTHSLHEGNFREKIRNAISESKNVIVIISQGCFDQVRQTDYWYLEIREALIQGKNIIPILFDKITSLSNLNIPEDMTDLKEKNCVSYQHEYAKAAFDKLYSFLGLGMPYSNPRRGCLMKYRGCMFSIMLAFVGLVVLTPIALSIFNEKPSQDPSLAKIEEPKDSSDNVDGANRIIQNAESDGGDKQLASANMSSEENDRESASISSTSTNLQKNSWLSWAVYFGNLKNGIPNGIGELTIKKEHHLGDIQVLPGEKIKGQFNDGIIIVAILHKKDGTTITLRDIQLVK